MVNSLKIYHSLPLFLRALAISVKGHYLRQWRYGPETERLIEEAFERESWSVGSWKLWQDERLAYILHRAATKVPYYREYWLRRRSQGDEVSWKALSDWPILNKEAVRKNPLSFLAEDCDYKKMFCGRTSGTTGTPVSIYVKRETLRKYYAIFEARLRRWHRVSIKQHWAILGGQLVVPFRQKKPPYWVWNAGLNQLYLSTHHLSQENAEHYCAALKRYRPTHAIVYPSSAAVLARSIIENSLSVPDSLRIIFSNAEQLLPSQREVISRAFNCPVINTYGMGEMIAGASECGQTCLHLWPDVGAIEIIKDSEDIPVSGGDPGRIIATNLLNADMTLIRYETGDRGRLGNDSACACGRKLPYLTAIEGRLNDLIITPQGRKVFWLNPVFYGLPIKEGQFIQEDRENIRIKVIPDNNYDNVQGEIIVSRLQDRVGKMNIKLETVDRIPRSQNGKFKAVISLINQGQ